MGISSSREPYGHRARKRSASPRFNLLGRRSQRRGSFRRRHHTPTTTTTTQVVLSGYTVPLSYQQLYGPYYGNRPVPYYPALEPIASPMLPLSYNNYSAPSNISPQLMMMQSPRITPPLFMPPPSLPPPPPVPALGVSTPYAQPAPIQPVYNNNLGGGAGIYSPPYPSAPVRLLTDWTGGGQISPGFLGPPI